MTDLTTEFRDNQIEQLSKAHQYIPFQHEGHTIFYAGKADYKDANNWKRAEQASNAYPEALISDTKTGQLLEGISKATSTYEKFKDNFQEDDSKLFNRLADAYGKEGNTQIWLENSREFAASISGTVQTFVCGARDTSIFRTVELPTLLDNEKVTTINGVDRQELKDFRDKVYERNLADGMTEQEAAKIAADATHRKVAIAEVRQDLAQARLQGNQEGIMDSLTRLDALREQSRTENKEKAISQSGSQSQGGNNQGGGSQTTPETQELSGKQLIPMDQRLAAIYDRAYQAAENKAAENNTAVSAEDLAAVAQAKVDQVTAKMELLKERADLRAGTAPVPKARVEAYHERELAWRDQRSQTHQEQGQLLGKPNQGLQSEFNGNRTLELERRTLMFKAYANLDQNTRSGVFPRDWYDDKKREFAGNFKTLQMRDIHSHGVYWGEAAAARHSGNPDAYKAAAQAQGLSPRGFAQTSGVNAASFTSGTDFNGNTQGGQTSTTGNASLHGNFGQAARGPSMRM